MLRSLTPCDLPGTKDQKKKKKKADDGVLSYKEPCIKRHVFHCVVYIATVPLAGKISRKSDGRHRQSNSKPKHSLVTGTVPKFSRE